MTAAQSRHDGGGFTALTETALKLRTETVVLRFEAQWHDHSGESENSGR